MLPPTKLDKLPEPMVQLMAELQDDIIKDVCRRVTKAGYMTPTAEWQLYKANQLQLSAHEVKRRLAKGLKMQEKLVKELYTDAVKEAINEDSQIYKLAITEGKLGEPYSKKLSSYTRSVAFNDTLRQGLKNTNGLMRNLTNSMAAIANRQLSDALDLAYLKVASGSFTPAQAIFEAVQKLGAEGIKAVKYDSGRTDQVDVAVRRAVLTGINKTCCDMQLKLANEMDSELVEVSSHLGARPTHAEWQGQIYSLKKGNAKYPYFNDATGYGTGDGLGGWNCRHSFFPFFEGISQAANAPTFSKAENLEEYTNSQQQRSYERSIRKTKRELAALDSSRSVTEDAELKAKLDRQFERKAVLLKRQETKLQDFCKKIGSYVDGSRVRVGGFGRSAAQKIAWAVKKRKANSLQYSGYSISNTEQIEFSRIGVNGAAQRIIGTSNKLYVSTNASSVYSPLILKRVDSYISKSLKKLKIQKSENLPDFIVLSANELPMPGAYSPVENKIYLNEQLFFAKTRYMIQKEGACPKSTISTIVHELFHWQDAEEYRKKFGKITDILSLNEYLNKLYRIELDKLEKQGYNVKQISIYASRGYVHGNLFETYTEYRTNKLLKG